MEQLEAFASQVVDLEFQIQHGHKRLDPQAQAAHEQAFGGAAGSAAEDGGSGDQLAPTANMCKSLKSDLQLLMHVLESDPEIEINLPKVQEILDSLVEGVAAVSESMMLGTPQPTWADQLSAQLASPRWSRGPASLGESQDLQSSGTALYCCVIDCLTD